MQIGKGNKIYQIYYKIVVNVRELQEMILNEQFYYLDFLLLSFTSIKKKFFHLC